MGRGSGYGKVILFGEHFVIYGTLGIISALDRITTAVVMVIPGNQISMDDRRSGAKGYTEIKKTQQMESIQRMLRFLNLNNTGLYIQLNGNLPTFSGIGASGASSVAIARALSDELNLNLPDDMINSAAHEAEKAYHGDRTAGLDNVASTYGGLICFRKNNPPILERLRLLQPIEIVMADTGIVADTKALIEGVAERCKLNPERYNRLIQEADSTFQQAKKALIDLNLPRAGELMNVNHQLLKDIEVGHPELDHLCDIARRSGAIGAKQTGGGGGGCIVALTPSERLQEKVASSLELEGYSVLRTQVGDVRRTPL